MTMQTIAYGPLADEHNELTDAAALALPRQICTFPTSAGDLIGVIDLVYPVHGVTYVEFRLVGRQPLGYEPNEALQVPASELVAGGIPR